MEAIVLAGGFGTRLSTVVSDVPKPMAPINGRPFLEYLLNDLSEKGINRVILAVGYKKEIIKSHFKEKYKNIDIIYSDEDIPLGTGGAIKKALILAKDENIFIINGDTFFDVDLKEMYQFHKKNSSKLTLAIKGMEKFDRYGSLILEEDRIIKFEEKKYNDKGYINGGIYLINKELLNEKEKESFSFEKEILENENLKIEKYGYKSEGYFIDIGIPEDYYKYIELKAPKISVIVPIYNREKYLEKCLQSIVIQDFKDIEIICVNDGSLDNSLYILEAFKAKDSRIIIINNKNNKGSSYARNIAILKARGKYCLNIDSDDWIEQGYLKALYERAEKDDLDITISDVLVDYEIKNFQEYRKDLNISEEIVINNQEYLIKFFTCNFIGYTVNKLIKKELYLKNKLYYNEKIFLLEDVELIGKLAYFSKKIGKINKAFYHYRIGNNNGTFNNITFKHLTDTIECFKNLELFYEKYDEKNLKKLVARKKNLRLLGAVLNDKFDDYEEYNKFVKQYLVSLKVEKYILKKYQEILNDEQWKKIFIFNILKILPNEKLFYNIKKIIKMIKRKKK